MEAKVIIVTFRDIFQYEAGKKSRYSDEYRQLSALILLDKQDMAGLGVKDGQRVMVGNELGRIVAAAKASEDDPHPGLAFMTNSPWSNQLVRDDVCETSIPGFKRIEAVVSPTDEAITQITELLQRMRA
jgi:formylmethanofuran dehydrogenase subunit D